MKKMMTSIMMMVMSIAMMFGMSTSQIRTNARFLSDRMAYELDLSPFQYDDVYEINYDYIYAINRIMDDVVMGYRSSIFHYYELLDQRNDDLRYVLSARQYRKFMEAEYFYRPVYSTGRKWAFRIHTIYSNHTFFYFDAPRGYRTYNGAHYHTNHANYYSNRYHNQRNDRYTDPFRFKGDDNRHSHASRNDFGVNYRDPNGNHKNNYGNANQNNRTHDPRYEDKSGNQNSPNINHRNEGNGRNESTGNGRPSGSTSGSRNGGTTSRSTGSAGSSSNSGQQTSGTVTRGRR